MTKDTSNMTGFERLFFMVVLTIMTLGLFLLVAWMLKYPAGRVFLAIFLVAAGITACVGYQKQEEKRQDLIEYHRRSNGQVLGPTDRARIEDQIRRERNSDTARPAPSSNNTGRLCETFTAMSPSSAGGFITSCR